MPSLVGSTSIASSFLPTIGFRRRDPRSRVSRSLPRNHSPIDTSSRPSLDFGKQDNRAPALQVANDFNRSEPHLGGILKITRTRFATCPHHPDRIGVKHPSINACSITFTCSVYASFAGDASYFSPSIRRLHPFYPTLHLIHFND